MSFWCVAVRFHVLWDRYVEVGVMYHEVGMLFWCMSMGINVLWGRT